MPLGLTRGSSPRACLTGVGPMGGDTGRDHGGEQCRLMAAGCLAHNEAVGIEAFCERCQIVRLVGDGSGVLAAAVEDRDGDFADIATDESKRRLGRVGHAGYPLGAYDCLRAFDGMTKPLQLIKHCKRSGQTTWMTTGTDALLRDGLSIRAVIRAATRVTAFLFRGTPSLYPKANRQLRGAKRRGNPQKHQHLAGDCRVAA